jgi:YHS domain-containing protein
MKRDPVCNLLVDEAAAFKLTQEGRTFYFCSGSCLERFLQEGEQKVSPGAKTPWPKPVAVKAR